MGQPGSVARLLGGVFPNRAVAFAVTFAAARGSLAGRANHPPVRASAPAARFLRRTAGPNVRPGANASSPVVPSVGADTQLTAAAGASPTPAAAVDQPAGVS